MQSPTTSLLPQKRRKLNGSGGDNDNIQLVSRSQIYADTEDENENENENDDNLNSRVRATLSGKESREALRWLDEWVRDEVGDGWTGDGETVKKRKRNREGKGNGVEGAEGEVLEFRLLSAQTRPIRIAPYEWKARTAPERVYEDDSTSAEERARRAREAAVDWAHITAARDPRMQTRSRNVRAALELQLQREVTVQGSSSREGLPSLFIARQRQSERAMVGKGRNESAIAIASEKRFCCVVVSVDAAKKAEEPGRRRKKRLRSRRVGRREGRGV